MPVEDPNELDAVDRAIRINEMREEAQRLAGGEMLSWESEQMPPEWAEAFWRRVLEYENAPLTSHFEQLISAGVDLPAPETMTDAELTAKLWEMIERLADFRVFVSQTDHLSDRELYTHLWAESLHEPVADLPLDESSSCCLDILGGCSEEDLQTRLKYYADEEERRDWLLHFPEDEMPPHEDPPFDRDRHLPRSEY